ncbi:RCC1 domain-containing protein, partial [Bacillus sp. BAU-SS-2023]|nr:RCC1 domain-containing protein [Bacillus sp. BAU-SS-2023]
MDYLLSKEKVKRWPKDMIAAGRCHTVGLKSDGTVVAVGRNKEG